MIRAGEQSIALSMPFIMPLPMEEADIASTQRLVHALTDEFDPGENLKLHRSRPENDPLKANP